MDERKVTRTLLQEGFRQTDVWQDAPNTAYPDHTYPTETTHIILSGEMTLTMDGKSHTYRAGECSDVPAGAVHSARKDPSGCRYLVGERWQAPSAPSPLFS